MHLGRPACWMPAVMTIVAIAAGPAFAQLGVPVSYPQPLNTYAPSDLRHDIDPQVVTDGHGTWPAVWDSRDVQDINDSTDRAAPYDWEILFSRSMDNGATWSTPAALNNDAHSDKKNDRWPTIATDGQGNWVAVWSRALEEDFFGTLAWSDWDLLVARSDNGGMTWTDPQPLNSDAGRDRRDRDDWTPRLATDGEGHWVVVWVYNQFIDQQTGD